MTEAPKVLYVTRTYEVRIPADREMVAKHVKDDYTHVSDAEIVINSDEAIAVWLTVQYDAGNYTSAVDVLDVSVTDKTPDIPEYELKPDTPDTN